MAKGNAGAPLFAGSLRALLAVVGVVALIAGTLHAFAAPALADPASPITVTVTATPSPAASGAQITYTITTENTGGAKVNNVGMTDQLNGVGTIQNPPAAPQFALTSSKGTCTQSAQLVSCSAGTLAGGETWVVTIRGVVTAPSGSTLNNTASVTGTKSAQNFTTTASVQTLVQGGGGGGSTLPDLTINKTGPSSVAAGAAYAYTLTVNNIGTANATNVKVSDTLPSGVALASVVASSLFACSPTSAPTPGPTTVVCTGGAVNQGQNATITLNVTAPASGSLTNTAVVDPDNAIAEGNELNNTSATVNTAVTGTPAPPSLAIVTTDEPALIAGAGPDPVVPAGQLTYKIRVTNNASTRADDVVVVVGTQGLDAAGIVATQAIVDGTVGNGNGCTVNAPQVRCSIRTLNPGGTQTVTIAGTVVAPAGTSIFTTATATGNVKNVGVSATDTETTAVRPAVDLTITKADSPDPVCARSWPAAPPGVCIGGLTYTFVVGNSGIGTATDVAVRDALPAGVIYDSFANGAGSDFVCPTGPLPADNVLACTNPGIGPSSTESFSIVVVAPASTGPVTNSVTVDPNNAIFEADETNNTFTTTTQVGTGIDLTVFKFDEPGPTADPASPLIPAYPSPTQGVDPVATNGTAIYTIYVDDLGPQDVTGVRVRDILPAGTTFLSASGDHGFTCAHDGASVGGNVECQGGHLLGTESEFYDHPAAEPDGIDPQGNDFATIVIRVFATPNVQPVMHNEVRVDPNNEIAEVDEANNIATQDTVVGTGDATENAFNQLKVTKTQTSPAGGAAVATNGTLVYNLHVENDGTDPVSAIVLKDFLPAGTRFLQAKDTDGGPGLADAFFCSHDGAATGGVVTCTGGALSGTVNVIPENAGGGNVPTSRDVAIAVFAPNTPGTASNLAKVDPDNTVPEGNEFDNESQVATPVKTAGDGGQNSFNQLTIAKVDSPDPVSTSSTLTYTLTVGNSGTDPAFGVKVRDALPAGTTFISAADGAPGPNAFLCSVSAGTVDCTGATLSGTAVTTNGAPATRTIVVKVFAPTQPGTITNNAFVDPDNAIPEGDETDNHAEQSTKVVVGAGFIDLTVRKCDVPLVPGCETATPTIVKSNGLVTYHVEAKNNGTDPAFNVVVRDVLPAGTTFVSATDVTAAPGAFVCSESGGVVTCSGGTLDGSNDLIPAPDDVPAARDIVIVVRPPNEHNVLITNQVLIDPDNTVPESNETNNSDSERTSVQSPFNLTLDKEGPNTAQQNSVQDYVITVKNLGDAVTGVVVVDPLPVGLIPNSIQANPSNFTCELTENPVNNVRCVGDMGAAGSATDTVTITVNVFVTQNGGPLDNEACVDPGNTIVESAENDNCDTKTTVIRKFSPNLAVQKTASDDTATVGQTLTYTVTVSNVGDANAKEGWTVKDTLPTDVSIVGTPVATNGFTCTHDGSASGGVVTCDGPSDADTIGLAVGASTTITVQVHVRNGASTPFTNTATIDGAVGFDDGSAPCNTATPGDTCEDETGANQANNTASVTTSVGGSAIDLVVGDITDNPDPVNVSDSLVYTFVVTNGGTQNALAADGNAVVIRAALPTAGVTLQSGVASQGFACVPTSGVLTCTGDLDAGEATTVTITFTVNALVPAALHLEAQVDPANAIVETDETNNVATEDTTVNVTACNSCIELVMGQIFATPSPATNGSNLTYSFTVTNIGDLSTETDAAPNDVKIGIDLDRSANESSFVSFTAPPGFSCVPDTLDVVPVFDVICTSTTGLGPGQGALITITAKATTASTPSFVDFDATVDFPDDIAELNNTNNAASLRVGVV